MEANMSSAVYITKMSTSASTSVPQVAQGMNGAKPAANFLSVFFLVVPAQADVDSFAS